MFMKRKMNEVYCTKFKTLVSQKRMRDESVSIVQTFTSKMFINYIFSVQSDPSRSQGCADKHWSCGSWAKRDECRRNPRYMLVNCKKSCGKCPGKDRLLQTKCLAAYLNGINSIPRLGLHRPLLSLTLLIPGFLDPCSTGGAQSAPLP